MARFKRGLICLFIFVNLLAVFHSNRRNWFDLEKLTDWSPSNLYKIQKWHWRTSIYGHLIGADNRWEMYSYMWRDDWSLVYKARYQGEKEDLVLPLALQTRRALIDEYFFDFKEAKFRLNTYRNKDARVAYAKWLCKKYSTHNGKPIESVSCDLESTPIRPRYEAKLAGSHLIGEKRIARFTHVKCPAPSETSSNLSPNSKGGT